MNIQQKMFLELYDQLASKIFQFCFFRVGSKEDAEDLASQTFLKVWDYIKQGNKVEYPKTFIYKIAGNLVIDFYRTNKKNRNVSIDDPLNEIDLPSEDSFESKMDIQMAMKDVISGIDDLQDEYKNIVILRYINDLSIKEIAEVTDLSESNVSVRIHRAIDKLKNSIKNN